jgi:hypothetical protein
MLKIAALTTAVSLGIAVPATGTLLAKPSRAQVEQRMLGQMNGGPDGQITKAVQCRAAGRSAAFDCTAVSVRSSTLNARVVVGSDGLQTTWEPLRG